MPDPLPERRIRVGIDIVAVDRIIRLVRESPGVLDSVFTADEQSYCRGRRRCYEHLAARFAAKEAVLKAFGTGLGRRMRWTDVEVGHGPAGRPTVRLHGEVAALAARRRLTDLDLSLSHTSGWAVAQAVAVLDADGSWAVRTEPAPTG